MEFTWPKTDLRDAGSAAPPGRLLKEVTFSIERLNAEVSPIRWSRWAPDTQWLWVLVKGPNGWYHDEEFDDEGEEDAEMIQSPWNILHIIFVNIFLFFLVKMFHFIFLACWTWLQSTRLYMLSLVSSQNLPSPSWLFAEVLGLWDFRLRCWASSSQVWCAEMWSVFICYGPQVVSSEMVGLA